MPKKRIIFRLSYFNRLSFPLLLNTWEKNNLHHHFDIRIHENPLHPDEIQTDDIILHSFMTTQLPEIHREIKHITPALKEKKALLIGGGPHVAGDREIPFAMGFDSLFQGPGEADFPRMGRALLANQPLEKLYTYRETPDSDDDFNNTLPLSRYLPTVPPLEITRGCAWNCSYCSTHLHTVRHRTLESITTLLKELQKPNPHRPTPDRINFISPSALEYGAPKPGRPDPTRIEQLLETVNAHGYRFIEYGIFPSEVRPDTVTDDIMNILKKYVSNRFITIGAQSGSPQRLKDLKRGHDPETVERAVAIANAAGFRGNLDFIVGYPDETTDERATLVDFIKKLNKKYRIKVQIHHFIPLPGSTYGHRLPSRLTEQDKTRLMDLKKAGLATGGWLDNEKQGQHLLNWLKTEFPDYYARYR